MLSLVIAETRKHGEVIIRWLGLDEDLWIPVTYGSALNDIYLDVLLVRPLTGIREEHGDWFIETVVPRTAGTTDTVPKGWRPQAEEPVVNEHEAVTLWA
jgi:hypothetical protein